MPDEPEQPCCGSCRNFLYADFCGVGWCEKHLHNPACGDNRCNDYREITQPKRP